MAKQIKEWEFEAWRNINTLLVAGMLLMVVLAIWTPELTREYLATGILFYALNKELSKAIEKEARR